MKTIQELLNTICENIKDLIKLNNLNATLLAKETGIPRTTINSWVSKKKLPRADYIYILAEFFNVSTDYIYGREM